MTSLCGHDRGALIWALQLVCAEDDSAHNVPPYPMRSQPKFVRRVDDAIHDPAKLAEMLAARGRELGFFVGIAVDMYCRGPIFGARSTSADSIKVWVRPVADDPSRPFDREFTMPQARAILLQWLQLPDGAREEAERALRGET